VTLDRRTIIVVNRTMGVLSLVVGVAMLAGAAIWSARHREFVRSAATARGQVVANVAKTWTDRPSGSSGSSGVHRLSYCAVVNYADRNGEARSYQDNICFNPASFRVGDAVTIRYDPRDPSRIMIDRGDKVYLIPLAVGVVGALCLLGGFQRLAGRNLPPSNVPEVPIIPIDPAADRT